MSYNPPVNEKKFVLCNVLNTDGIKNAEMLDNETVEAVLDEAAKLARDELAPINHSGDQEGGCKLKDGAVTTPKGFKQAYQHYCTGGWNAVPFPEEFGGQDLPWVMSFAIQEMWQAANMSFGLCPLLNQGATEAILHHGSDAQKQYYLPKMISGEWTGTMNLTEPQAGSDLSVIRTKAEPAGDGTYKIFGQKIYITYGEHDFTENIIHLVLARLPDAPEGTRGISLFIVPKFLDDGTRNDAVCTGIEHKLGIHASPTCTMQFGDEGGAIGYLVGEENQGLKYMFTMMNNARLSVGLQGVAISERALQAAVAYAGDRVQGGVSIDKHPDVQRMLMNMRALTQAGRLMAYEAALWLDQGERAKVDLLTPVVKAWCTDNALEVTSLGVQVHGGMGFVEETGAAQHYRDARILPIYEGTNGIQAADLVFRKMLRDKGAVFNAYCETLPDDCGADLLRQAGAHILQMDDAAKAAFVSDPFLKLFGFVVGAASMKRAHETQGGAAFYADTWPFYQSMILPRIKGYAEMVLNS